MQDPQSLLYFDKILMVDRFPTVLKMLDIDIEYYLANINSDSIDFASRRFTLSESNRVFT